MKAYAWPEPGGGTDFAEVLEKLAARFEKRWDARRMLAWSSRALVWDAFEFWLWLHRFLWCFPIRFLARLVSARFGDRYFVFSLFFLSLFWVQLRLAVFAFRSRR